MKHEGQTSFRYVTMLALCTPILGWRVGTRHGVMYAFGLKEILYTGVGELSPTITLKIFNRAGKLIFH